MTKEKKETYKSRFKSGEMWFHHKEYLPGYRIKCDIYIFSSQESKWNLSKRDILIQETKENYEYYFQKEKE